MFFEARVPVLVAEETIFRREDHYKRLLLYGRLGRGQQFPVQFQKEPISVQLSGDPWLEQVHRSTSPEAILYPFRQIPVIQPSGQPFFLLTPKRPPPELFFDRFAGVYSVTEALSKIEATFFSPAQPWIVYRQTPRPPNSFFEDHSLETGQTSPHAYPYVISVVVGLFPYSFEVPDLNGDPWLEQIHRPSNPELALYPHRQIPQFVIGQPFNLLWWSSHNWPLESEAIWRVPDTSSLNQFRWVEVVAPFPPPVSIPPTRSAWTADSVNVTADSINFTCDGADLINDGGTPIREEKPGVTKNTLAYSVSVPLFVTYKGGD